MSHVSAVGISHCMDWSLLASHQWTGCFSMRHCCRVNMGDARGKGLSIELFVFTLLHSPGNLSVIILAVLKSASATTTVNYARKTTAHLPFVVIIDAVACRSNLISDYIWLHCVIPAFFMQCRLSPATSDVEDSLLDYSIQNNT